MGQAQRADTSLLQRRSAESSRRRRRVGGSFSPASPTCDAAVTFGIVDSLIVTTLYALY